MHSSVYSYFQREIICTIECRSLLKNYTRNQTGCHKSCLPPIKWLKIKQEYLCPFKKLLLLLLQTCSPVENGFYWNCVSAGVEPILKSIGLQTTPCLYYKLSVWCDVINQQFLPYGHLFLTDLQEFWWYGGKDLFKMEKGLDICCLRRACFCFLSTWDSEQ